MKGLFSYIFVVFISSIIASAQFIPKSHDDSIKLFLNQWLHKSDIYRNAVILNNSTYDPYDSMFRKELPSSKNALKIYYWEKGVVGVKTDSLVLTKKELAKIYKQILDTNFTWTKEYFPNNNIITQKEADFLRTEAKRIAKIRSDYYEKANYSERLLKQSKAYAAFCDSTKSIMKRVAAGYWMLSKPVFFRKGTYAAFFVREVEFGTVEICYGSYSLIIFKHNNLDKWTPFVSVVSGDYN